MKNKIRFAITALALVLFAACFFVACSDDVVSGKNNDHSYAEVLESNGAFVYKDKNYETLQDAIDAFAKDDSVARVTVGDQNKITVIGNAKTRGITIPEDSILYIDLNGFEVQFFDVDASAIKVGAGSTFVVNGGSFSLFEKSEELSVISIVGKADRRSGLVLSNLTIKADGQTAIFQDEYTSSVLSDSVVVNGATIARGGKENTSLTSFCNLPDVRMRGATLEILGEGVAVITENSGDNEFIVSSTATIIDKTGGDDPIVPKDGICYIERAGEILTFGSLKEAIDSLVDKDETINFLCNETTAEAQTITLSKPATIVLNGFSSGTNNIVLANGVELTITATPPANTTTPPSFTGTITSATGIPESSLIVDGVVMNSEIAVSGSVKATNATFVGNISAGLGVYLKESEVKKGVGENTVDITSAFGDIVLANVTGVIGDLTASSLGVDVIINNATGSLTTGKIKAVSHVTLTGSSVSTNEAASLTIGGTVELSGKLTSSDVLFKAAVSANAVDDTGSVFHKDITAKGDISLINSTLQTIDAITSTAGGNITIKNSWGWVDAIKTKAPEPEAEATKAGSIVINNAEYAEVLSIGEIKATYDNGTDIYYGDISLIGNKKNPVMKVYGSVTGKDIRADYCTFDTVDKVVSIVGNTVKVNCSVFETHFQETEYTNFYTIEATGEDKADNYALIIDSSSGKTGNIKATNGSVSASVSVEEGASTIITGSISAKNDVHTTGAVNLYLIVDGDVEGSFLRADSTSVNGKVELSKNLEAKGSVFYGTITAGTTIVDNGSTFKKDITAGDDITITGSTFASGTETNPAITSTAGDIVLTTVSGKTSTLTAVAKGKSIAINNLEAGAVLTTGNISANNMVSVFGNSNYNVTVGSISGTSLAASYAIVTDVVDLGGAIISADSVFNATVSADVLADTRSTFNASVFVNGNATFIDSVFASDSASILSQTGDIIMTKAENTAGVTGTVGNLTSITGNVTINTTAALSTGKIKAGKDVSVTGSSSNNVIVRAYEGASVDAATLNTDYAVVNGTVVLTGNMTSQRSVFKDTINADAVTDTGSAFEKAIVATDDVVLTGSTFFNSAPVTSDGNITMTTVTGLAGMLKASNVTVSNYAAVADLETGAIVAVNAVAVAGHADGTFKVTVGRVAGATLDVFRSTVAGAVTLTKGMTSKLSVFEGDVSASTVSDNGSTFNDVVFTNVNGGDAVFDSSKFNSVNAAVISSSGNIMMTGVTGTAGDLSAPTDGKNVTINNAKALAALKTGKITAGNAVAVTGSLIYQNPTKVNSVTVVGVNGKTLDASYAILDGTVELSGDLKSGYSVFAGTCAVSAFTVVDSNSTVKGDITAEEDATFENTVFHLTADIRSTNGNILMTKTTGESGTITASTYGKNVTIDNAKAIGEFTTAMITAGNAVTVTGNSDHKVTVAGVSGSTLDAVFSIFSAAINVKNDASINESGFKNSATVASTFGNIILTKVTGTAGALTAYSVTIDDAEAGGELKTGIITASDAVSVTGNSYFDLIIGGVSKASTLNVVHAIVSGAVSITGNLTSTDSTFNGSVTAATITDTRGTFSGSSTDSTDVITAKLGDVTLTDSKISVTAVKSETGKIVMTNVTNDATATAAGNLTASSVTINNSQSATKLKTGVIEATDSVTVKGRNASTVSYVDVAGVSGVALDVTYATISGDVMLSGNLKSAYSLFSSTTAVPDYAVSAYAVVDEGSTFKGAIIAKTGNVEMTGSHIECSVTANNGNIEMTKVTGTAGDLAAYSVTISNADATATLVTGVIKAVGAVDLTGNSTYGVTAAGVSGTTLETTYATVTGGVGLSGALTSTDSVFKGNVSATVITDERGTFGGTENAKITATTGNVILNGSVFDGAGVTSTEGSILMTKVTGTAGDLEAYSVTINNDQTSAALKTGAIKSVGAVKVTGNSKYPVTVGGVTGTKLDADYAVISGDIEVATGGVTLTDSKFENEADVTATLGNITMTKVTGTAGDLSAYDAVTIDNTKVLGTANTLSTGEIEANGAITLKGNDGHIVTVGNVNGQATMVADYVSVSGETILYGDLTSSNSTFGGRVSAAKIEDTRSKFSGAVYGVGDVKLTGSKFNSNVANVLSWTGDIDMTGVFGTAGSLTTYGDAKKITIDNSKSFAPLTTGAVRSASAVPGAVTVTGNAYFGAGNVTVGAISGTIVDVAYATVTGAITASGNVTLTSSGFSNSAPVTSSGNILMTKVTGTAGALTASVAGMDITINNDKATDTLTTGAITAADAVKVTGNSTYKVTAASVSGTSLNASYTTVSGTVTLTGGMTSEKSVFNGAIKADAVVDAESSFSAAIDAKDDVTLTSSVFSSSAPVTSAGDILMTKVTGTAGALTASVAGMDITINNAEAKASLTTGAITADDTVTVTGNSEYPVTVTAITTANLIVNADNNRFSATDVVASGSIAINGGTYTGVFAFSGSTASTISAGRFTGTFSHTGTAALSITGGLFTGTGSVQSLESGTTTIDGTYSSTDGWDVIFDNLSITGDAAVIKSGYFKAATTGQLNNIGKYIKQSTSSPTKFVELAYTDDEISGYSILTLPSSTDVKKAVVSFYGYPVVYEHDLYFEYPNTVELRGKIQLNSSSYGVWSLNRPLRDANNNVIVYRYEGSSRTEYTDGSYYYYTYNN